MVESPLDVPAEPEQVAATLTAAFLDDPLMAWVFEDASARPTNLARWWGWMLAHRPGHAKVLAAPDHVSTALWYGPDPEESGVHGDFVGMLGGLLGDEVARAKLRGLSVIPAAHPTERHWYLAAVGTRPAWQGRGRGLVVVEPVLAVADAEGIGCYLESSNARNVSFYARVGFVATGRIDVPDGPSLTPMWRAPRR